MEINGLPVHALIVHAAVVFGPLAALFGVLYLVPRFRGWLRWPLVLSVVVLVVSVWIAYLSGEQLEETGNYSNGPLRALLETHEERAEILRISATVFALVAVLTAFWRTKSAGIRNALVALTAVAAVVTGVYVVLTGDAGAQIAWYGTEV
jgi:uncharacterized membrane protein